MLRIFKRSCKTIHVSSTGSSIWSLKYGLLSPPSVQDSVSHAEEPSEHGGTGPLWTCVAAAEPCSQPACLPAWGQLGSRALWSEAPLGSPDWLESHLPNRLASCHKPMEKQRGLRGVKERKPWQRERQGAQVFAAKKKCLCSCMSDDNDYTVVILDCSSSLREVKNPHSDCGNECIGQHESTAVRTQRYNFYQTIFIFSRSPFVPEYEHQ